jgi:hypothetical protein
MQFIVNALLTTEACVQRLFASSKQVIDALMRRRDKRQIRPAAPTLTLNRLTGPANRALKTRNGIHRRHG